MASDFSKTTFSEGNTFEFWRKKNDLHHIILYCQMRTNLSRTDYLMPCLPDKQLAFGKTLHLNLQAGIPASSHTRETLMLYHSEWWFGSWGFAMSDCYYILALDLARLVAGMSQSCNFKPHSQRGRFSVQCLMFRPKQVLSNHWKAMGN